MKICILPTDTYFSSDVEFVRALSALPFGDDDCERLLSIKNKKSARESLCARMALLRICNENTFGTIEKSESGKPYFSQINAPQFSLSHTNGIAAAVIEENGNRIGLDIEIISTDRKFSSIAHRFFDSEELSLFKNSGETAESFYSLWTKKEARVKLFGDGLVCELGGKQKKNSPLHFYQYLVKFGDTEAILCIAAEREPNEIIFIDSKEFEIYELQN